MISNKAITVTSKISHCLKQQQCVDDSGCSRKDLEKIGIQLVAFERIVVVIYLNVCDFQLILFLTHLSYFLIGKLLKNGCRHCSVESSVPSILLPGFETQAHHLCFYQFIFVLCHVEKTKINKKRSVLAHFLKKLLKNVLHHCFPPPECMQPNRTTRHWKVWSYYFSHSGFLFWTLWMPHIEAATAATTTNMFSPSKIHSQKQLTVNWWSPVTHRSSVLKFYALTATYLLIWSHGRQKKKFFASFHSGN